MKNTLVSQLGLKSNPNRLINLRISTASIANILIIIIRIKTELSNYYIF